MILKLFRRTPRHDSIARLYGTIVAQARAPAFYQLYGVHDTVNGRLEMIMLHTVMFCGAWRVKQGRFASSGKASLISSAGIWTTTCAKWVWAISPCRGGCAGSARRFTAGRRPIG